MSDIVEIPFPAARLTEAREHAFHMGCEFYARNPEASIRSTENAAKAARALLKGN